MWKNMIHERKCWESDSDPFYTAKVRSNFAEISERISQSMQAAFGAELKFNFQSSHIKSDGSLNCPHHNLESLVGPSAHFKTVRVQWNVYSSLKLETGEAIIAYESKH